MRSCNLLATLEELQADSQYYPGESKQELEERLDEMEADLNVLVETLKTECRQ